MNRPVLPGLLKCRMPFLSSRWVAPILVGMTLLGLLAAATGTISWPHFLAQTVFLWLVVLLARERVS